MFKHLLVCVDGSQEAAAAEDLALKLAGGLKAVAHGLHVIDSSVLEGAFITDISGVMGLEPFFNGHIDMGATLHHVGEAIRARFAAHCAQAGVDYSFQIVRAPVVKGILEAAKLADLIVVGRRGTDARFREDRLGPTTETLLRRSSRPVLVVPPEARFPTRPLAAYDGSAKAASALQVAATLCRQLSLPLAVVTVSDDVDRAARNLGEAAAYLEPYGLQVTYRHEQGEAVEEMLLALLNRDRFDLLFLGAHGHTRVVDAVLGSTSEFMARRSSAPVLCVTRA